MLKLPADNSSAPPDSFQFPNEKSMIHFRPPGLEMRGAKIPMPVKNSTQREKIVSAAAQLFARQGYHGTSTREIARLADVSENTIFRHFDRKEDLFWSALRTCGSAVKLRRDVLEGMSDGDALEVILPKIVGFLSDILNYS